MTPDAPEETVGIREFNSRIEEIQRAVEVALVSAGPKVELREHIEALFTEQQRANEIAERERAAAAEALRQEQHHTAEIAAVEREKSAQIVADNIRQAIREGDARLHEHILSQVAQIDAAHRAAEMLETERFERAKAEVEAVRRELMLIQTAARDAVTVAQEAQEKRNQNFNEWKSQFAVLIDEQRAQVAGVVGSFMSREAVEARLDALQQQITAGAEKLSKLT